MNDPENFLSRWSRRKREPEESPKPVAEAAPETSAQEDAAAGQPAVTKSDATLPEPVFDPASLPPLDSIGAETDISAFLKANVPSPLRLAALRRAWLADPAIRDFKGMAEYDWDFTAPGSMPGFGEMDPATDVQKMLTELFGDKPNVQEAISELPNQAQQIIPLQEKLSGPMEPEASLEPAAKVEAEPATSIQTADNIEMVQREENIAVQDKTSGSDDSQIKRRRSQGSALPQ
jgi:hypothetical protein